MHQDVHIIPSDQIDQQKWDACIDQSDAPLIYAKTFYLHHMADEWHGVVWNDYECVMPIPWRKKYTIRYTYQVPFIQQLGFFKKKSGSSTRPFLEVLQKFCRYGYYAFNYANNIPTPDASLKNNYILSLSTYEAIAANYSSDLLQNLKKSVQYQLQYHRVSYEKVIDSFYELYHQKTPHVSKNDFLNFKKLCSYLHQTGKIHCREVSGAKDETLALILLLQDGNRLYNMMNATPLAGRKMAANHFLIDKTLEEFCNKNLVFDFEGSDIPGIKNFYENFGASLQPYASLQFNKLPAPIKYFTPHSCGRSKH
ncbi:MAG: hypothetical protein JSS67_00380 [Bacteroidetes bacterium]|nr:hypothetical protein [Bacteroidota bacterium]